MSTSGESVRPTEGERREGDRVGVVVAIEMSLFTSFSYFGLLNPLSEFIHFSCH